MTFILRGKDIMEKGRGNMTKTIRWYHKIGISYNPYWFRHELIYIRKMLHRKFRHNNRIAIRKYKDVEIEPRTRGWITY